MYRSEVADSRRNDLVGGISITVPITWRVFSYFIAACITAVFGFLCLASYSRVETATGAVIPAAGISTIIPARSGTIVSIRVHDGQEVKVGDELVEIKAEEDGRSGSTTALQVDESLQRQKLSLNIQSEMAGISALAQLQQLADQKNGLAEEISQLSSQISIQSRLIRSVEDELTRIKGVADKGFISGRDMTRRQEDLLTRQQSLSQLEQALAVKRGALLSIDKVISQSRAENAIKSEALTASRAQIDRQVAENNGTRSYVLRASIAGRVTSLLASIGQAVDSKTALMSIIPSHSTLEARLYVPTTAIGFIKRGQEVRLSIDAYPYQQFGTLKGVTQSVAANPITRPGQNNTEVSVYPVTVALNNKIEDRTSEIILVSGMTLTARITTNRQPVISWIVRPITSFTKR